MKGVFKPHVKNEKNNSAAEIAAYKASLFLGFPYVPPTVLRTIEINNKPREGSLQLFIESDIDPLAKGAYEKALLEVGQTDLENLQLFCFVFGQWDSGPRNLIIVRKFNKTFLLPIDNSKINNHQYVQYGGLPFVQLFLHENNNSDKDSGSSKLNNSFPFEAAKTIVYTPLDKPRSEPNKTVSIPQTFYDQVEKYRPKFFRYVIFNNSLWRQFHYGDNSFIKSFTKTISKKTKAALKKLSFDILKNEIFCLDLKIDDEILLDILDRRNQVLSYFKSHKI